jgi:hypothetical protein
VYVVGTGLTNNWTIRKSTDGGGTWNTVDSIAGNGAATAIAGDGAGNIYAVGKLSISGAYHWYVRESGNGTSWATVDDYEVPTSTNSAAYAVGFDLVGNAYVVGSGGDSSGVLHHIVRSNAGGTWTTVSDLQSPGSSAAFNGITVDPNGVIYTASRVLDQTGTAFYWTIQDTQGPTPSALAFSAQAASVTAGAPASPAFAVKIKTAGGSTVVGDTSTVTLSILSGPAGGKLSGTFTAKANHGIATFSKLLLTKAGTYRLKATDGKLASASSASFKLVAARPAKLAFIQQPPAGKVGKALSPAVTVAVQDTYGNVVATDHSTIKLSINAGPAGAILSGVVSVADVSGIATFSNLRLSEAGTYKLKATDGTDAAAISAAFKIS